MVDLLYVQAALLVFFPLDDCNTTLPLVISMNMH